MFQDVIFVEFKTKIECKNCCNNIKKVDICVVEDIADQWSIEASNIFDGYFHILGGTLESSQIKGYFTN